MYLERIDPNGQRLNSKACSIKLYGVQGISLHIYEK